MDQMKTYKVVDTEIESLCKDAQWSCEHGVSDTYPCPDCYSVWRVPDKIVRTRDWQKIYRGGS